MGPHEATYGHLQMDTLSMQPMQVDALALAVPTKDVYHPTLETASSATVAIGITLDLN